MIDISLYMTDCSICPRNCHVNRDTAAGFCHQGSAITAARAALHMWEEPCISGVNGSGAVFFSGCNMGCVFCQNYEIAHGQVQKEISIRHLADIFLRLQDDEHAHNINLVTPSHFIPQIVNALELAKNDGLVIPIVYNTSSYEKVESLKMLDGLIDIYLPDFKYVSSNLSKRYSACPDYFNIALPAIKEMYRQVGNPVFRDINTGVIYYASEYNDYIESMPESIDNNMESKTDDYSGPLMTKGVIVRHLTLPGQLEDSKNAIRYLLQNFGDSVYISIMNQFTPMPNAKNFPELGRRVTSDEYEELIDYAIDLGLENGFLQGDETASESFIPAFDYKGL